MIFLDINMVIVGTVIISSPSKCEWVVFSILLELKIIPFSSIFLKPDSNLLNSFGSHTPLIIRYNGGYGVLYVVKVLFGESID